MSALYNFWLPLLVVLAAAGLFAYAVYKTLGGGL